jgi:hypothetical protein
MSDLPRLEADYAALNKLAVDCPELTELETQLGGFNLFQVLKFEYGELRHSNVLAWLMDPKGSHGMGDVFLQRWLMRVVHESGDDEKAGVSPVELASWQMLKVDVRREWNHIDVLLVITLPDRKEWIVCIENKVNASQHQGQLRGYREFVEQQFPGASKLFIFLRKNDEAPADSAYLVATYTQVHRVLKECLASHARIIGEEPLVLINNYVRLLEEKFMNESKVARTALAIYQKHKRALDVIFAHRPENILQIMNDRLWKLIQASVAELRIKPNQGDRGIIRFTPLEWDHPGNTHNRGWSGISRNILLEVRLVANHPEFSIVSAKSPAAWIEPLQERAKQPPFISPGEYSPGWLWLSKEPMRELSLAHEDLSDPAEMAEAIFEWTRRTLQAPYTREMIQIIADRLPELDAIYRAKTNTPEVPAANP